MSAHDPYGPVAEYYDLLAAPIWASRGPLLRRVFGALATAHGPVLDLGAGTGLGLAEVAQAAPSARLLAVEPSRGMRIALSSRVAWLGIAERTTIHGGTLADCTLPAQLAGVLALGVVGHLSPNERTLLWDRMASRLAAGARALIDVLDRTAPPTDRRLRIGQRTVGERRYESWSEGRLEDDGTRAYTIRYRVLANERVLSEETCALRWAPLTLAALRAEIARHGLMLDEVAPDMAVVTRSEG